MRQQWKCILGNIKKESNQHHQRRSKYQGTVFQPMEELIKERLQDRVVEENWLQGENHDEAF